jgi:hypothetical protein
MVRLNSKSVLSVGLRTNSRWRREGIRADADTQKRGEIGKRRTVYDMRLDKDGQTSFLPVLRLKESVRELTGA